MRLGEILVEMGACAPDRVREALEGQVVLGGRLGTNLLDIDAVAEDALARALSRQHGRQLLFVQASAVIHRGELVVDTIGFRGDHHWMDQDGPAIPAGEKLHIVERFRMVNDGKQLEIEFTMTDPDHWEGEWKSTKRFNRVVDADIQEVSCLPDLNEHIRSTTSKTQILQ